MSAEYRVGIIGLGRMGAVIDDEMSGHPVYLVPYSHAAAFDHEARTTLVAGSAPSEESRARFQARYGDVRTYADYNQMLEEETSISSALQRMLRCTRMRRSRQPNWVQRGSWSQSRWRYLWPSATACWMSAGSRGPS